MLRNYVGDDAFFKSLNNYLTTNKFKTGEAAQLRLAFEETTGKDLNWFWNQWYYGSGHPKLKITYNYDVPGQATVTIEQTQKSGKVFKLPMAIDVYAGNDRKRYNVWVNNKIDSFSFPVSGKVELINVDAEKILLCEKNDNKTEENYIAQWKNARNYMDRKEALDYFAKKTMPELARGLQDKFHKLRISTIQNWHHHLTKQIRLYLSKSKRSPAKTVTAWYVQQRSPSWPRTATPNTSRCSKWRSTILPTA